MCFSDPRFIDVGVLYPNEPATRSGVLPTRATSDATRVTDQDQDLLTQGKRSAALQSR